MSQNMPQTGMKVLLKNPDGSFPKTPIHGFISEIDPESSTFVKVDWDDDKFPNEWWAIGEEIALV